MTMQEHVDCLAARIEEIACGNEYSNLIDYFGDAAGIGFRETDAGEYESAIVALTFQPTINFDTATGEIHCCFYNERGKAKLSSLANRNVNEFFRTIHNC